MANKTLTISAMFVALSLAATSHADVVVKDTLDSANFTNINFGGGFIANNLVTNEQDGRTYFGFNSPQDGILSELRFNFIAIVGASGEPANSPSRSTLFDLNVGFYDSLADASSDVRRTDAFFPEATQPSSIFENPVGMTAPTGGLSVAQVFRADYDLSGSGLEVTAGQNYYLGISATGVPGGISFQPQRSDDSGVVIGSEPDYTSGSILPPGLSPMSTFYTDAIQNSVRITITNFGDVRDGDFNQDQVVNGADYLTLLRNFGATSGPGLQADGNVDGVVDGGDSSLWAEYFGQNVPLAATTSVPEPSGVILSMAALCFGLARTRR